MPEYCITNTLLWVKNGVKKPIDKISGEGGAVAILKDLFNAAKN